MHNGTHKTLAVFGATGSIGRSTLDVVRQHPEAFSVRCLSANNNAALLVEMILEFRPAAVAVVDPVAYQHVRDAAGNLTEVLCGEEALNELAARDDYDTLVSALVGFAGLQPTISAIKAGHNIALANKETLVVAGEAITLLAARHGVSLLPIDSEHSAILQCILGEPEREIARIILTASGGPFRGWTRERLRDVTPDQALLHPNWSMGNKITIDSATLMNKGLEVIEAHWLFGQNADSISVLVHPQSIVHSMVEFSDGSVKAQLGVPDMKIPIHYALSYPGRIPANYPRLDLAAIGTLTFEEPDIDTFPCLSLAYEALRIGGTAPAVMNAANEIAVGAFLNGELAFTQISELIAHCIDRLPSTGADDIEAIIHADKQSREIARTHVAHFTTLSTPL